MSYQENFGSSPNRVGEKGTEIFSALGVRSAHGGTESAGKTRNRERLLGFRKTPVPDPLSENRILAQAQGTKEFSDPDR
jgi:hypothetical protein